MYKLINEALVERTKTFQYVVEFVEEFVNFSI